ncbi:MAG: amidohydrolase family protein [Gammaproteobacteria bacterium]|nr:amidohydrolase family protein [Gammaproteobacteria bacterium]MCY4165012.1 amidohydrolase family protein [Gammaproteobacteria bacterium]MCY4255444.1 amidohydrolase family protein [Gammaproteobacteria bacterium]MCY4340238.1 amidohydrolase family protein [Gammaproteobacteria bacterium]
MNARARLIAAFAPALLAVGACQPALQDAQSGIAISNVTVIDAVSGERTDQTVLIDGDRIAAVGDSDSMYLSGSFEMIDGTGKFLIPGLWDMHVHLTYDERLVDFMPGLFIRYGITSVRDTGGLMPKLRPVVERMRAADAIAPRVFFSGPLLDGEPVVYDGVNAVEVGIASLTPAQAEANVADLKAQGVDFIKIYEMVTPEVFDALIEAGRSYGLPIAAHVPLSMRASAAAPRVDSMEHLRNIVLDCVDDAQELLETRREYLDAGRERSGIDLRAALHRMQRLDAIDALDWEVCGAVLGTMRNTIQVPTARLSALKLFPVHERGDWPAALARMPPALVEEWSAPPAWMAADPAFQDHRFGQYMLDMIGRMRQAGVPIGAGTDTPLAHAIPGYSLHNELEILVAAGLTPLEALGAATVQPAAFFSLQDQMGAVAPGMRADLVLLRANPLSDIRNTRFIDRVIARGRLMPTE